MIELSMMRDVVAIFGVIAGFSYYVLIVRMNQRTMRMNLTNNLVEQFRTDEFLRKVTELMYMEWEDYDDFEHKYGSDGNLENYITKLVLDGDPAYRHDQEGPDDMAAHIRSVLTQSEITIPVQAGRLALGTWQGLFLWEHRYRAHRRKLTITLTGS